MTTKNKIATVLVEFDFADDINQKMYDKFQNRVQRYIDGTDFVTTASFFVSRKSISVSITYDITGENEWKIYDYLGKRLTTLIDWHKDAATYQWHQSSILQNAGK